MKYIVIWEQEEYGPSWVNEIITEDYLDDYIAHHKNNYESQEHNKNYKIVDVNTIWDEVNYIGEVIYLIDYGQLGKEWTKGFYYCFKEINSFKK